jgi:hypothetical protein
VSLSLLDKYVASLALESVSLVRLRAGFRLGFRPGVVEKLHAEFLTPTDGKPWSLALEELEKLLMKSQAGFSGRGLPITIVLSNQFVRYKIIPAMPPLTTADKILAVASHYFRETYGDIVDDWSIRVNPLPDGDTVIASAVDSSLLAALETMMLEHACKLKSIQPYLMSGFNSICSQIKTLPSCYVQVEAGRLNIALIRGGAWYSVTGSSAGQDWPEQLSSLIDREMLLAGWQHEQPTIYLAAPNSAQDEHAHASFAMLSAWKTVQVPQRALVGYSADSDQQYSMALSVAG